MSYIVSGYGFNIGKNGGYDINAVNVAKFMVKHANAFGETAEEKQILDLVEHAGEDEKRIEDVMSGIVAEQYYDEESDSFGFGALVAAIMRRETGIRFHYFGAEKETYTKPSIIFAPEYPWKMNETEKKTTEKEFHDVCLRYMKDLEIPGEPGEVALEYLD